MITSIRSWLLVLTLFFFLSRSASAQLSGTDNDCTWVAGIWKNDSGGYECLAAITGYVGLGGAVVIPPHVYASTEINGVTVSIPECPVTLISDTYSVFCGNTSITSICTSNVTSLTAGWWSHTTGWLNGAFQGCTNLETITMPAVTTIGSGSFKNCPKLTNVTIPSNVISIGDWAFWNCTGLKEVTISPGVTSIGQWAFENCIALTKVTFPPSLTQIGTWAFRNCTSLTSVTIPSSVSNIGVCAFENCTELREVEILPGVIGIGGYAFYLCAKLTRVEIPPSVTSIGDLAFCGCGLTSVIIPERITSIGTCVFSYCSMLTHVEIPYGVTSIGYSAFQGCSGLTSVMIPASVTHIRAGAFYGCSGLVSLIIPSSVTSIEDAAFCSCSKLASVEIPASVTTIGERAFQQCAGLTSIIIPEGVTTLGSRAFSSCNSLVSAEIPSSLANLGDYTFEYCSNLTDVTLRPGLTRIGDYAFTSCFKLNSFFIPDSVTSIGSCAFFSCSGLTSLTIPESVTSIGNYALAVCTSLTRLTIPDNVTSIGDYAFAGCNGLTCLVFMGRAPIMGSNVFYYLPTGFTIYYLGAYKNSGFTSPTWQGYPAFIAAPYGGVIPNLAANEAHLIGGLEADGSVKLEASVTHAPLLWQRQTTPVMLDMEQTRTLLLGATGTVRVDAGDGALTIGKNPGDGFLTAGGNANTPGTLVLDHASANDLTINAVIANNGNAVVGLTKNGSGRAILNASNSYSGETSVNDGTLVLKSARLADSSAVRVASGSTLKLEYAGTDVVGALYLGGTKQADGVYHAGNSGGFITGTGSIQVGFSVSRVIAAGAWSDAGNWSAGIADGATFTADFSGMDLTADRTMHLNSPRTVGNLVFGDTDIGSAGGFTLDNNGNAANILTLDSTMPTLTVNPMGSGKAVTISAEMAGSHGLTKAGVGTLILSAAQSYTGPTIISDGTVMLGTANALPTATAVTLANTTGAWLDLNGYNQTIASLTGGGASGGFVALGGGILTVGDSSSMTYAGVISGAGGLTKTGTGTLTLSAAQSYSGPTVICGGTLKLVSVSGSPVAGTSRWFDASKLGHANGQAVTLWNDGSGNGANASVPAGNSAPTFLVDAGTGSGLGAMQFNAGTSAGGGANNSQSLVFPRDSSIRSVCAVFKGASFLLTDSGSTYDFHRPGDSNPADPLWSQWTSTYIASGRTYVNGVQVNGYSYNMPTDERNGYNIVSVVASGAVTADGFNKDRVYHSGAQSHAEVLIYDFELTDTQRQQNEDYLYNKWFGLGGGGPILPSDTAVSLTDSGSTLDLANAVQTIGSLSGVVGSKIITSAALSIGNDNSNTTFSGTISGPGSLTKTGSGSLVLAGANSYAGGTTINQGILSITQPSFSDISTITIASGAVLDLPNTGTDVVGTLDLGGTLQADGVYDASNTGGRITGAGSIRVSSVRRVIADADGIWSEAGMWAPFIADGASATADFSSIDTTADRVMHLDAPRSIGHLIFGDADIGSPGSWTIDNHGNAANILTLAGTTPTITVNALAAGKTATIQAAIAGTSGFTKLGVGTLALGNENTYSGATIINGGTLKLLDLRSVGVLAHRWSFNNSLNDSVGDRPATLQGSSTPALSSTQVTLAGGAKGTSWVDLGSNILATGNTPITIEIWATENQKRNWSRIFDFGSTAGGTSNLLWAWTQGSQDPSVVNNQNVNAPTFATGTQYHIALVLTPDGNDTKLTWYQLDAAGNVLSTGGYTAAWNLSQLIQNNMWLGHSEYPDDDASASYDEVRIWNSALTQAQLSDNSLLGPDSLGGSGSIAGSSSVTLAAGAVLDTTAQALFAIPATQPFTIHVHGSSAGSCGRIHAAGLDITNASVVFAADNPLDDPVYILADYSQLTGSAFASVTPPSGYVINYAYNGATQIALVQTGGAFANFAAWADANAPGQSTDQDHNHDGVANGIEYFMGKSGNDFTANPGIAANGTVTWPKSPAFSGSYVVQTSADLLEWADVTDDTTQVTKNSDSVVWKRPVGPECRFVRLLVMPN